MLQASYCVGDRLGQLLREASRLAGSGQSLAARRLYLRALDEDPSCRARNGFGIFLTRIESFSEAVDQFSRVLSVAQQQQDPHLICVAAHNLAAVYREMGQWSQAARCQQRALAAGLKAGTEYDASCHLGTAWDAIRAGELPYARQMLLASLRHYRRLRCRAGQADVHCGLGIIAYREGAYVLAAICFWKAHRLHRSAGQRLEMARDLMNLGQLFLKIGRYRRAHCCLKSARAVFAQMGARRSARRAGVSLTEARRCWLAMHTDPLMN